MPGQPGAGGMRRSPLNYASSIVPEVLCAKLYEIIKKELALTASQFVRRDHCGNSNRGMFSGGEGGI